jgi:hypothetical protein
MDRAVYSTTTDEFCVGGIYDSVGVLLSDVTKDETNAAMFEPSHREKITPVVEYWEG